jgi:integrase
MKNQLVLVPVSPESRAGEPLALTPAQALLRKMVLDSVVSPHSKRNYAKALDDLFAFCASRPLSRSLLMEWRAGMEALSPSTINVRLSAVRKLVGEARRNNMIGSEEAANRDTLSDWAVWSVVEQSSKQIGIEHFGAHDLRRTCAKLCRKNGGDLEQIKFLLGHSSIQTTERYLGSEQDIEIAVNDNLGL